MLIDDPVVDLTLRACLALLFAATGWHKARDVAGFCRIMGAYRILPASMLPTAAVAAIGVELLVAIAILCPPFQMVGAVGMVTVLALYSAAIAVNLARGRRDIDCGCGGAAAQPLSAWLVVRNLILMMAAGATLTPSATRPLVWLDWLTLLGAVAVLAASWAAANRLLAAGTDLRARAARHAEMIP
jgi:uncharacterized membrane protein YphA (DoxX/SURF4 family)